MVGPNRAPLAALVFGGLMTAALSASFYGESYVELKLVESSSKTSLQLRFRTSKPNGLIFLAAGQEDYCLVELHSGYVQVKLNFGAGEKVLRSEKKSRLNDLAWHKVELHHVKDNVTLTVDSHSKTSGKLPGELHTFNLQHGLYVGGKGGLDAPYLKGVPSHFRGCIDDVFFNEHDLLTSLRPYPGFKNVHEVSLGCSDEFFATEDEPISFFSSKSYMSFPFWNTKEEGHWQCLLQTTAERGLLLYNSGRAGDFIAVEIAGGLVKAHIGKSGTKTQLSSLSSVNNNKWHSVMVKFTPRHLLLTVDEETLKTTLPSQSKVLPLKGPLFVGGVDDSTRTEVIKLGLASMSGKSARGGSFKGCLKDLKANSETKALVNVLVTKDISPGCTTETVLSTIMTITTEKTPVKTVAHILTTPRAVTLPRPIAKVHFLVLTDLVVAEGGRATLESKHMKVNLEFKELGIRQSQVIFKIVQQPEHGELKLDIGPDQVKNTFTMLDLWRGKVLYVHDGSEAPHDQFMFSVLTSSKKPMPAYLQGSEQYTFNITVTPTNDPPELALPEGNLFVLLENSKKRLSTELIKVIDLDTDRLTLTFSVLGNLNADAGYLENSRDPEKVIKSFSYSDLEEGNVVYVHNGVRNSRLVLRASDGELVSNTVVLRIMAVPLDYQVVNNTGLEVLQGDSALITQSHLAVQTNAVKQEVEIRYDITEPPKFGQIQRQHSGSEWKQVHTFSQRSLERKRVRYAGTFKEMQLKNITDQFKFKVSIGSISSDELLFPISVKWLKYKIVKNQPLDMNKMKRKPLSSDSLYSVAEGIDLPESELFYRLSSIPQKASLYLDNKVLRKNNTFSQKDLTDHKVEYELAEKPLKDTEDSFRFSIFTKYAESKSHSFQITLKADLNSIIITNNGLLTAEGEGKLITQNELFVQTLNNKVFSYKVKKSPRHGKLRFINFSDSQSSNDNITAFTNQDIISQHIMYVHDDSETVSDEFHAVATSEKLVETLVSNLDNEVVSAEIVFNISIELKNDEKPIRLVDKVFHVVKNGQRLLTTEDLCYHDPDIDFDDGLLLYTRRGIPNGDLVLVNDTAHKLYQFSQGDLEQRKVLFIHRGADYGRFVLFVTDGKHYTSSLLEVSASDPYVRVVNNTGLLVQKGKEKTLSIANFSAITNQDITSDKEIVYDIYLPPKYGMLFAGNVPIDSFTHQDLKHGDVIYRHDDSNHLVDQFNITVKVKDTQLEAGVYVRMYLESHQRPPKVLYNKSLLVEEGKPVKIDKESLQVVHEDNSPLDIVYTLTSPPKYGYIRMVQSDEGYLGTELKPVSRFTQQDINNGNMQYVQTVSGQLQDAFTVEVTNGVRVVNGIGISIDVIPKMIPLEVQNLTVVEGASKALTEDYLKISNLHFTGLNSNFILLDLPTNGYIENTQYLGKKLSSFSSQQVEKEFIFYVHDGSETLWDNFTIVANNTELRKVSLPQTVYVTVTPVNDEAPVITTNTIFRVWVGSITEITPGDLAAEDRDSAPAELVYSITPPSNGLLALKDAPSKGILNFTQAHINEGQLLFVHNGAMSGGFNFQVTDGLHFAPRQIFSITARTLVITLEANKGLALFPGTKKSISSSVLQAVTNDKENAVNRTITYTVVEKPKLGRLITLDSNNLTHEVSTFSQLMVDESLIVYEHMKSEAMGWSEEDSFTFTVSSPPAFLDAQVFQITISYDISGPGRHSRLLANTGAVVLEGDKVLIDKSKLDASNLMAKLPDSQRFQYEVWYQVTSLPKHGLIVVGERNVTKEKPNFSQYIVNKFGITYIHDGLESLVDDFTFDVWLNLKSKSATKPEDESDVTTEVFNVTIIPVNDQVPELKTKGPHLKVLQGSVAVLGPENLKVEDLDNTPEEIKYTIISHPNNGYLAIDSDLNTTIQHFTQADIDGSKILFVQDGSASSGVFYFSVTDGKHRPLYKLFNLEVTPVSITITNITDIVLKQSETFIHINNAQLAAVTNGKSSEINYEVVHPPKFGHLLLEGEKVSTFKQSDLDLGMLSYHMTDFSASHDKFEIMLFTSENNLTGQVVHITVQPLLKLASNLTIPNGIIYKLRRKDLDASELANITDSDPKYELTEPPVYGRFVKRRAARDTVLQAITVFTQGDIEKGLVLLDLNANMTDVDVQNDSFSFVLKADNVPPAVGTLTYTIVTYDPLLVQDATTEGLSLTSTIVMSNQNSSEQLTVILPDDEVPTEAPQKSVNKLGKRNRWGIQVEDDGLLSPDAAVTISSQREITTKAADVNPRAEPNESSNPLFLIVPLVVMAVLFIGVIMSVCFFLMCRKPEKPKPLIEKQTSNTAHQSTALCPERSQAVPTVTVTPLQKGCENISSSPLLGFRREHLFPSSSPPMEKHIILNNLPHLDPEMALHCRTTNPTLRQNQYWV
ncbi:chondroitin sulfate proteoglycan 4-like [Ambystoma mexicanum]|uniref:chondroitin sulfate proteoglycan 4-like n=1 Tax=Ambystoma mexicanum TaxID=8296 RepID=UPI0037E6F830